MAAPSAREQLLAMGFEARSVDGALRASGGHREDALCMLLADTGAAAAVAETAAAVPPAPLALPEHGVAAASAVAAPAASVAGARDARVQRAAAQLLAVPSAAETVTTLRTLVGNVLEHPEEAKYRRVRRGNKRVQRTIGAQPAALDLLAAIGFRSAGSGAGTSDDELTLVRPDLGLLWLAREALCGAVAVE